MTGGSGAICPCVLTDEKGISFRVPGSAGAEEADDLSAPSNGRGMPFRSLTPSSEIPSGFVCGTSSSPGKTNPGPVRDEAPVLRLGGVRCSSDVGMTPWRSATRVGTRLRLRAM